MPLLVTHETKPDFQTRLASYRASNRGARPYDIAEALGVSELEVMLQPQEGLKVRPLAISWDQLFKLIPELGRCMALTRNDSTVSEVKGFYGPASFHGPVGLVHHDTIDLRLFTGSWAFTVAVENKAGDRILRSLQIFDKTGRAIHKVYPQELTEEEWNLKLAAYPTAAIRPEEIAPRESKAKIHAATDLDVEAFRKDWAALEDTHDFHALLRKHKVERQAAFECAGEDFARPVQVQALETVLQEARKAGIKFMIFVGNAAMIQIRSGTIKETRTLGSWFNILDPDFNLHVNMQKLGSAWIVKKPSRHGDVISLEVFEAEGDLAISLFGYRTDNLPVDPAWATFMRTALPESF